MRDIASGIYRMILGTFPVIDLPGNNAIMRVGKRADLLKDLRLSDPANETLDFGQSVTVPGGDRRPLKNHLLGTAGLGLMGDAGRPMLLGHKDNSPMMKQNDSQLRGPQIAKGLY